MAKTLPFETHAEQYDAWFDAHPAAYASELEAIRAVLPREGTGVEIGVGTGRFAGPLGVRYGVEPSQAMRDQAQRRGIEVVEGQAEALPLGDARFDYALMVTTICFLDDVPRAFGEIHRILKPGGAFVVGLIDRASPLGRQYEQRKEESVFYREAYFHTTEEVVHHMQAAGFRHLVLRQTLFGDPASMVVPDPVREGKGEGAFAVIRGLRPH